MVINIIVNGSGRDGLSRAYWVAPHGPEVNIRVVNGATFPLTTRIFALVPNGAELRREEIKRLLHPSDEFGFRGRAVEFRAGGDWQNESVADTNLSTGTVEITEVD